jgi:5-methylcytosine-specific restriction endonuclease McrA
MLLLIGPNGGISWDNTQTFVRHNIHAVLKRRQKIQPTHSETFGSVHLWETFKCDGRCGGRILPIDIADVDHIAPKSNFNWKFIRQNALKFQDCFACKDKTGHMWAIMDKGTINCISTSHKEVSKPIEYYAADEDHIFLDIENNVDNLQLLCPPCNRSKGAKTGDQYIPFSPYLG